MVNKPLSPLFQRKGSMFPLPGEGVGGIDLGTRENLIDDKEYATHQHHADPDYSMPFGQKGTELEGIKHGTARKIADNSVCVCGHQWHEHWHQSDFGCKSEGKGCKCKGFASKTASAQSTDASYQAALSLFQSGWLKPKVIIPSAALEIDRVTGLPELMDRLDQMDAMQQGVGHARSQGVKHASLEPTESSYRAAQLLAQLGQIQQSEINKVALDIDRIVSERKQGPRGDVVHSASKRASGDNCLGRLEKLREALEHIRDDGMDARMCMVMARTALISDDEVSKIAASKTAVLNEEEERFREELKQGEPGIQGYLFRSDTYCPSCGQEVIDMLLNEGKIGPPGPNENTEWTHDSDVVPQPLMFVPPGTETCTMCGKDITSSAQAGPTSGNEITDEDRAYLKEMNILGSLKGLAEKVAPVNPLLKSPDPETATFFKESEEDGKQASEKSYGAGTPLGGTANGVGQPAPGTQPTKPAQFQQPAPTPSQTSVTPPTGQSGQSGQSIQFNVPPTPPGQSQLNQDTMVKEIVKQLQDKMSSAAVSKVNIHEAPEMLPPRTDMMKHLDETLVDDSNMPPFPLSKGADWAGEEEEEDDPKDVTDLGTMYGKPIGNPKVPRQEKNFPIWDWKIDCPECKALIKGGTKDTVDNYFYKHWTSLHSGRPAPSQDDIQAVPYRLEGKLDQPPPAAPPKGRLRFTPKDKDFLKGMGIKGSAEMDAETWWRKTPPDGRRDMAGKLGIEPYWTSFVWGSLPPETQQEVITSFPAMTEPTLDLTDEDKKLLGEMNIQASKEGKEWDPNMAKQHYDSGCSLADKGDLEGAFREFSDSIRLNPYYGPAHFRLGIVFAQDAEEEKALGELKQALRSHPKDEWAYHSICTTLENRGDLDSLPQSVKDFLDKNVISKQAGAKVAIQTEEGVNLVCPNCHGTETKPVDDPEAEGGNLVECLTCGGFFAK